MKKFLLGLVSLLILCLCMISCTEDLGIDKLTQEKIIDPEHLALIESMGLCIEDIIELEEDYVVEGDIALSKEAIESYLSQPRTRQARWGDHVSSWAVEDIRVSTVALVNDSWKTALIKATKAWNNIPNCPVYFRHVGNWAGEVNANMDATISSVLGSNTVAYANMPLWGVPGLGIRINPDFNYLSPESKISVMVHELGHIIALGHTNYKALGESQGNSGNHSSHIAGTPTDEWNSVMTTGSAGRPWDFSRPNGNFTAGDMAAVQAKYGTPIWSCEIVGPDVCLSRERYTYTLNLGTNLITTDIKAQWYVNNNLWQSIPTSSFTTSMPLGQATMKAVVSYGGKSYETTKDITVFHINIIGEDDPLPNTYVTYSTAAFPQSSSMPEGVTFSHWTISPETYTMTGELTDPNLNILFNTADQYTLTANFIFPDGTTQNVLRFINAQPLTSIFGPDRPIAKREMTFSVPTSPSAGVNFSHWTVYPETYTVIGGLSDPKIKFKFSEATRYTVTANFTMPDNSLYGVSKLVDALPMSGHPRITGEYTSNISPMGSPGIVIVRPPEQAMIGKVECRVESPRPGETYKWDINGKLKTGDSIIYEVGYGSRLIIHCRALSNFGYSDWSNSLVLIDEFVEGSAINSVHPGGGIPITDSIFFPGGPPVVKWP